MSPASSCASDDLLTTAEVAALAEVSIATVNRWGSSRRLTPVVVAKGRVYRRADVMKFLAQRGARRRVAS